MASSVVYSSEVEKQARAAIKALAKTPKGLPLQALIQALKTDIEAARQSGYTLEEIAKTLSANGAPIKANTLKQYLKEEQEAAPKVKQPLQDVAAKKASGAVTTLPPPSVPDAIHQSGVLSS